MAEPDYSGWQFQELPAPRATPADQQVQATQPQQPTLGQHTPEDYAILTTQQAIQNLHDMGGMPEVGTVQDVFKQALSRAQDYQRTLAEKQAEVGTEYAKQLQRVAPTIGTAAGPQSLLSVEEAQKAAIARQTEQWKQGPGASAIAAAQAAAGHPGEVADLPEADREKLDMLVNGYNAVNNLSDGFNYMMSGKPKVDSSGHPVQPPPGVGGQFRSLGGKAAWFADATSQSALNFDRLREAAMILIARAVLGEVGATPTKAQMVEMALEKGLPRIQDDEETGNNAIFNMKHAIMQQLQNMYNDRKGRFDTTSIANAIANYNSDFQSQTTQAWNPLNSQKGIASGLSQPAQSVINNLNQNLQRTSPQPQVTPTPTIASDPRMTAGAGTTQYPTIANTPGAVEQPSAAIQALLNAPGQIRQALTPKPGGPAPDLTAPPMSIGPSTWGQ